MTSDRTAAKNEEMRGGDPSLQAKFDLGPDAAEPAAEPLPWGYGRNAIHTLVVDPERLFLYWEVTDEAIAAARAQLEDAEAKLFLRIHDTTGIPFDGSHAHRHLDVPVSRQERQRFVDLPSPGSEQCAEIGVRGDDGGFAPIARSQTVALPRREPSPSSSSVGGESDGEWMTVHPGKGGLEIEPPTELRQEASEREESDALPAAAAREPEQGPSPTMPASTDAAPAEPVSPPATTMAPETPAPARRQTAPPAPTSPWRGSGQG